MAEKFGITKYKNSEVFNRAHSNHATVTRKQNSSFCQILESFWTDGNDTLDRLQRRKYSLLESTTWWELRGKSCHCTTWTTWWFDRFFFFKINTFCTHPWIFLCANNGERLQVNNKDVFMPEAWFKFINKAENGIVSVGRQDAKIHFPLRSLRHVALRRLAHLIQSKDDIYNLEIPKSLKAELNQMIIFNRRWGFTIKARANRQDIRRQSDWFL